MVHVWLHTILLRGIIWKEKNVKQKTYKIKQQNEEHRYNESKQFKNQNTDQSNPQKVNMKET